MKIPLARPFYDEREAAAVAPVIQSGWVSQGPKAAEFEQRVAAWIGTDHAVATNSCTSAMQMALHLSGIGPGDEVICPAYTCMATANAILQVGAHPSFVDINPVTFNMEPRLVAAAVGARTRAIMAVHQIGLPCDLAALAAIATSAGLRVIEDAGCALGAAYLGRRIGTSHDPVCFSLHPRKTITTGEGGVLVTRDAEFAARARAYRSHGASVSALERHQSGGLLYGTYSDVGHNFRFTDVQAAIGVVQMDKIDDILRRKTAVAARYTAALETIDGVTPPAVPAGYIHAWQSYLVTLSPALSGARDRIILRLSEQGISSLRGIAPLHREPVFARGAEPLVDLPHSDDMYHRTIFLPIFAAMTTAEVDYVIDRFAAAVEAAR